MIELNDSDMMCTVIPWRNNFAESRKTLLIAGQTIVGEPLYFAFCDKWISAAVAVPSDVCPEEARYKTYYNDRPGGISKATLQAVSYHYSRSPSETDDGTMTSKADTAELFAWKFNCVLPDDHRTPPRKGDAVRMELVLGAKTKDRKGGGPKPSEENDSYNVTSANETLSEGTRNQCNSEHKLLCERLMRRKPAGPRPRKVLTRDNIITP